MDLSIPSLDELSSKKFDDAMRVISDEYRRLLDAHVVFRQGLCLPQRNASFSQGEQTEVEDGARADVPMHLHRPSSKAARPTHDSGACADAISVGTHSASLNIKVTAWSHDQLSSSNNLYHKVSASTASDTTGPAWNNRVHELVLAQGWMQHPPLHSSYLEKLVKGTGFDAFCGLLIILNSLMLAICTNYAAINHIGDDADMPIVFSILDKAFGAWFLLELLLRIAADGIFQFWSCSTGGTLWNYFDTAVVLINVVEVVMQLMALSAAGSNVTALRILRVLRLARAMRAVRLIHHFKACRMMVLCILHSLTTLMWAMVLLLVTIFIFAILLTQNVTNYLYRNLDPMSKQSKHCDVLDRFFGSLAKSTYTLFLSVSGGIDWIEISEPLFKINTTTGLLFCLYVFFTLFWMLNIISGIFVDTAMRAAQSDRDEVIAENIAAEDSTIRQMKQIFIEADRDGSGEITEEEFRTRLSDPGMRAHLAGFGIDGAEAEGLFRLLDLDNSGSITVDEFIFGCMRMKGGAKALDLATLLYENKRMVAAWTDFMRYVEKQFKEARRFQKEFKTETHAQFGSSDRVNRRCARNMHEQAHMHEALELSQSDHSPNLTWI